MKTLAQPIEMISWTEADGKLHPVRFKISSHNGEKIVYKIQRVYTCESEKMAGNKIYRFTCEIVVGDTLRVCEIRYELDSCKWVLFKL